MTLHSLLNSKLSNDDVTTDWTSDKVIRSGIYTVVFGIGFFLLWSFTAELSKGVVANGSIVVDGNRKTVQHLEGGIVKNIHVTEGSAVKAGDVLIELDPTQPLAQQDILETRYLTNVAIVDRLTSELNDLSTIAFSDSLKNHSDPQLVATIQQAQTQLFLARKAQINGELDILKQKQSQLEQQIIGLEVQKTAGQNERNILAQEYDKAQSLQKKGLIAITGVWDIEKELNRLDGSIGQISADMATSRIAIGEAKLQELQVVKAAKEQASEEMLETQKTLYDLKEQLSAANDVVNRTLIRAPQNGIVMALNYVTVGGVVQAASPIMEIVPSEDRLIVEVQVRSVDIDAITMAMPVRIRLSGFNQRITPLMNGAITHIAADATLNEESGQSFYKVRASIHPEELEKLGDNKIVPGMPVEVLINAGSRTPMEYFTEPLSQSIRRSLSEN